MAARQDDGEFFPPDGNRHERLRQLVEIRNAEIGGTAAHILDHCAVHAVPDVQLDAGIFEPIGRDQTRQFSVRDRHDAGDDDLPAALIRKLPHAADGDAQIVQHASGDGDEFLARGGDRDRAGAAVEQLDAEDVLDVLDGARDRRLRSLHQRGGCNEAAIFGDRENGLQLARGQIGDTGSRHSIYALIEIIPDIRNSLI